MRASYAKNVRNSNGKHVCTCDEIERQRVTAAATGSSKDKAGSILDGYKEALFFFVLNPPADGEAARHATLQQR